MANISNEISVVINVLCFSESTDDDKVVSWHWEEVKGPLREEKASGDTAILTLTNLVPGNYTFRYVLSSFSSFTLWPVHNLVFGPPWNHFAEVFRPQRVIRELL